MSDVRAPVVVGVAAALAAVALAGRGLLLPGGDGSTAGRLAGAGVALVAAGVLVRLDGPLDGARSLAAVSVAGLVVGLATMPWSPVTLTRSELSDHPPVRSGDDGADRVILDRVTPGDAAGALVLPPGAEPTLEDGRVVLRFPDGGAAIVGRAAPGGVDGATGPRIAPDGGATGDDQASSSGPVTVTVVDGVVGRSDGAAIGGDTPLAGLTLRTADGDRVFVGDGVLLPAPAPLPADDPSGARPDDDVDVVLAVLLMAFALVAFAPPVVRIADRVVGPMIHDTLQPTGPAPPPPTTVEEGVADVLASMLADPDPRTAVIGAYARLLAALAEVGFARRDEETPHEHLWRCLGPLGVRRAPVHRLAELFVRARFTPHPVTDDHRRAAIAALADTVADLRLRAADVDEVVAGARPMADAAR